MNEVARELRVRSRRGPLGLWAYRLAWVSVAAALSVLDESNSRWLLAVLCLWMAWELCGLSLQSARRVVYAVVVSCIWVLAVETRVGLLLLTALSGSAGYIMMLVMMRENSIERYNARAVLGAFATMTVLAGLGCADDLLALPEHGRKLFVVVLVCAGTHDLVASWVGRRWAYGRLAPLVSPRKTASGATAGAGAAAASALLAANGLGVSVSMIWAAGLAVCCVVGDLIFSSLKRSFARKDFSAVFGGKGGVLDRADSCLIPMIMVYGLAVAGVLG